MKHEEKLKKAKLFSLEKRKQKQYLITAFKYLKSGYRKDGDCLFSVDVGKRTRSSDLTMQQRNFRLEIRKNSLTMMVMKH